MPEPLLALMANEPKSSTASPPGSIQMRLVAGGGLGLALDEGEVEADGETLWLGDTEAEGLTDALGDAEPLGDTLGETLDDGLTLADGLTLGLAECDGDTEPDGETLAEGLTDADGLDVLNVSVSARMRFGLLAVVTPSLIAKSVAESDPTLIDPLWLLVPAGSPFRPTSMTIRSPVTVV
jgi:hypothetical protein